MILYHSPACSETECAPDLSAEDRRGTVHSLPGCLIDDPTIEGGFDEDIVYGMWAIREWYDEQHPAAAGG